MLVTCPKCGEDREDLDGFGVLACEKCGYCTHPHLDGDGRGSMVCVICRFAERRGWGEPGAARVAPADTRGPGRPTRWRTPVNERRTLTVPEAARALGVGKNTAYELVRQGRLRALRLGPQGRRLVVPVGEIDRLLADSSNVPSNVLPGTSGSDRV
jgi:excisionase family DNA binding protein